MKKTFQFYTIIERNSPYKGNQGSL